MIPMIQEVPGETLRCPPLLVKEDLNGSIGNNGFNRKRRSIGLFSKPSLPEVDLEKGALGGLTGNPTLGTFRKNDISDPETGDLPGNAGIPGRNESGLNRRVRCGFWTGRHPRLFHVPNLPAFSIGTYVRDNTLALDAPMMVNLFAFLRKSPMPTWASATVSKPSGRFADILYKSRDLPSALRQVNWIVLSVPHVMSRSRNQSRTRGHCAAIGRNASMGNRLHK
jgi:hypothetical protein